MAYESITFNGIRKDWLYIERGRSKPPFAARRRNLITVPGYPGGHLQSTEVDPLTISQPVGFRIKDDADALVKQDELAEWLLTDEPVPLEFDDEPGRIYYAVVQNTLEDFEKMSLLRSGTIQFICPDPYAYGQEKAHGLTGQGTVINVAGTAEAKPVFELEVLEPVTFAMISNGDEYNLVGRPASASDQTFVREELVMHDDCTSLAGWITADKVDNGKITGAMKSVNGAFVVDSVGTPVSPAVWQGPSIKRDIGATLENFRMATKVSLNNLVGQTGMIEIYLLDAFGEIVAKIGIEDVWRGLKKVQGKFQMGEIGNREAYYREADYAPAWNNFDGILQIFRDNGKLRPYFALIDNKGKHVWVSSEYSYNDVNNNYHTPITQIQIAFRMWPGTEMSEAEIKDIKFWRYKKEPDKVPYIAQPGDIITFDHTSDSVYLNGQNFMKEHAIGGTFFKLKKGDNTLAMLPDGAFNGSLIYRTRYK
ncbi:distal tail protein Dit [Paraliobacillus salinarum]|uniref:distal tail protein Dit n=1 Tax=Paraliobacillus salinarum TaxID=1158996 RepID=UPI0015F41570|nr:distal tail protein Dit [Paraliobacillus salinarum]